MCFHFSTASFSSKNMVSNEPNSLYQYFYFTITLVITYIFFCLVLHYHELNFVFTQPHTDCTGVVKQITTYTKYVLIKELYLVTLKSLLKAVSCCSIHTYTYIYLCLCVLFLISVMFDKIYWTFSSKLVLGYTWLVWAFSWDLLPNKEKIEDCHTCKHIRDCGLMYCTCVCFLSAHDDAIWTAAWGKSEADGSETIVTGSLDDMVKVWKWWVLRRWH